MIRVNDIENAAERISGWVSRTPIRNSPELDSLLEMNLLVKAENMQRTGSFKFRGAVNWMLQIGGDAQRSGVVAGSSGNHGFALAEIAAALSMPAEVVISHDAPTEKISNIQQRGARVTLFDRFQVNRDSLVREIAEETRREVAHSSDDVKVICGNGTVALEILDEVDALDALVVPVGGGGLASGCGTVVAARNANVRVYGVEPAGADDTLQSIQAGRRCSIVPPTTIADGLRHCTPGEITYPIMQRVLADILLVEDPGILRSMWIAWRYLNIRLEPSGAVALAAIIANKTLFHGKRVVVVGSGGNCDADIWRVAMHEQDIGANRREAACESLSRAI